jgi:hypothetical protein
MPSNDKELLVLRKIIDQRHELSLSDQSGEARLHDDSSRVDRWRDICRLGHSLNHYPTSEPVPEVLGRMLSDDDIEPDIHSSSKDYQQRFKDFYVLMMSGKSLPDMRVDI